ncbi:MAG TPA: hypothetical protein VGM56_28470 [Byssovorax sp.]|jgi:hypothetical protein
MARAERRPARWIAGAIAAALTALATVAAAAPTSEQRARELGAQGLALFDKGDFVGALVKLHAARDLYAAPSLSLAIARCERRLGHLLAASAAYLDAAKVELPPNASTTLKEAQAAATRERAALAQVIPTITLVVEGASDAAITIDDARVPADAAGQPRQVDPGVHAVEARAGDRVARASVTVAEGDTRRVSLSLAAPTVAEPASAAPVVASQPSRWPVWVALGGGVAGLAAGGVFAGLAASKRSSLDTSGCNSGHVCPPSAQSDVDAYNGARVGSTVGFIAGGVGVAAAGVLFFVLRPSAPASASSFVVRPTANGVGGEF